MSRLATLSAYLLASSIFSPAAHAYDNSALQPDTTAVNAGPLTTQFVPPSSCFDMRTRAPYGNIKLEIGCGEGPMSSECCPDNWASGVFYSPGMCPSGYHACPLSSSKQRLETTNICCPMGYRCAERNYCFSYPETTSTLTYSDEKLSTVYEVWYYAATPIQIRFKAEESDIVPVPTGSFSLPREFLYTREKVGIGIGVTTAVGLVSLAIYYCWFVRRRRRAAAAAAETEFAHQQLAPLVPQDGQVYDMGPPPPYPGTTGDTNPKQ